MRPKWKLLVENSIDGYHATSTTTGTSSTSPGWAPDLGVGVSGVTRDLGNGHAMLDTWRPRDRPVVKWEPLSGPTAKKGNRGALSPAGLRT